MKEGWEYKKLGEVAEFFRGLTYSKKDEVEQSDNKVLRSNNIDLVSHKINIEDIKCVRQDLIVSADKKLKDESILICMSNGSHAHLGKTAFVSAAMDYAFGGFMGLICPEAEKINPKFCFYATISQSFLSYIIKLGNGANIKNLKWSDLQFFQIAVPPLSEQQAIVEELDLLNAIIYKKKEELEELDKLAQSIFYDMFGDPVENEKGWEVKKLSELSSKIGDGLHGTPSYMENSGYYFVNGNNLEKGSIVYNKKTKQVSKEEYDKYYIEFGKQTIFVSINGTIGKLAYYRGEQIILGKSACYINLKENVNKVFIYSILSSDYFKKYTMGEKTGSTISNVSLKSIRFFPVPLPPLPLQQKFAVRISAIEQMKENVSASMAEVQTLLAATMDKYFG